MSKTDAYSYQFVSEQYSKCTKLATIDLLTDTELQELILKALIEGVKKSLEEACDAWNKRDPNAFEELVDEASLGASLGYFCTLPVKSIPYANYIVGTFCAIIGTGIPEGLDHICA